MAGSSRSRKMVEMALRTINQVDAEAKNDVVKQSKPLDNNCKYDNILYSSENTVNYANIETLEGDVLLLADNTTSVLTEDHNTPYTIILPLEGDSSIDTIMCPAQSNEVVVQTDVEEISNSQAKVINLQVEEGITLQVGEVITMETELDGKHPTNDMEIEQIRMINKEDIEQEKSNLNDPDWIPVNINTNRDDSDTSDEEQSNGFDTEKENSGVETTVKISRDADKKLRLMGQKYQSAKWIDKKKYILVKRKQRLIKPKLCKHTKTTPSSTCSFMCGQFLEDHRKDIFIRFWNLDGWNAKKAYLKGLVDYRLTDRRRKSTINEDKRKMYGYDCYLPNGNGIKVRVCRDFFLSTLDLKKDSFSSWISSPEKSRALEVYDESMEEEEEQKGNEQQEQQPRALNFKKPQTRPKTIKDKKSNSVEMWLNVIRKVPSHYCRSSSSRVYVESSFRSLVHMHQVYMSWCEETGNLSVKRKKFCEVLEKNKISIHKPRKDQCDTCVSYKEGNLSQTEYDLHILKKEEAREAKENAISLLLDEPSILVITMDVQSVLVCPKLLVYSQYYKQKLQLHNFSIYVSNKKDVHLYVWHEGDGAVSSNEITSCVMDFIQHHLNYNKIIIISDGCAYQDKNRVLANALANATKTKY